MDPNHIIVLNVLGDGLGKQSVGFTIGLPGGLIESDLSGMIVE